MSYLTDEPRKHSFQIIIRLYDTREPVLCTTLCKAFDSAYNTMARALRELMKDGLVESSASTDYRAGDQYTLTHKGRLVAEHLKEIERIECGSPESVPGANEIRSRRFYLNLLFFKLNPTYIFFIYMVYFIHTAESPQRD